MNGLQELQQAAQSWAESIEREMEVFWRANGITPPSERPYLGNRCGWYPEKPKRKARRSKA